MLSRVWVERAGSESAVFGGARPWSDLVDMPIDTVYMSMDMPCHATLCYAWLLLSLTLSLSLSSFLFVSFPSPPLRSHTRPPCSSILLISSRDFFVPSSSPSNVTVPSLSLLYSVTLFLLLGIFLLASDNGFRAGDDTDVLVDVR